MAEYFSRHWIRLLGSLLILGFYTVHSTKWHEWDFIKRLEAIAYDARLVFTMPRGVDDRLVIVDIDEKSLAAEGRWPWSRDKIATMLDRLFDEYGVAIVGFDVVFAESEEVSGVRVLDELESEFGDDEAFLARSQAIRAELDHDARLSVAIGKDNRQVVLGYFFSDADSSGEAPRVGQLPAPVFPALSAQRKRPLV